MADINASAIIERLLEDDYVHEQMAAAGAAVRDVYRRVRRLPPHQVVQDPTVYDRARDAATALSAAVRRVVGEPAPKPPPRRRALPVLVLLATGAVVKS